MKALAASVSLLAALSAAPTRADMPLPAIYTLHCSGCHGEDGAGVPGRGIPNLEDSGYYLSVPQGRQYLIEVPGLSQSALSDAQVAQLLNYILRRFSTAQLPKPFASYSTAEVARYRSDKASDAESRRQAVLQQIQQRSN